MKSIALIALFVFSVINLNAQEEHNLVPNPGFEEVDGKIKDAGKITLAEPWRSGNLFPVDLYSADAKSDEFGVPENKYGAEPAKSGNNYAGVSFYGYRGRMPRTYLATQLKNPMTEGKEYCLKFHVSLADKSKYAVNNLAMYVSKEDVVDPSEKNLSYEPQVKSITNNVFEQQYLWTPICRTYNAQGGEEYIVIGNFNTDEETETETLRMSREFSGRQSYDAYYFIDDVSVIPTEFLGEKDCSCDKIAGGAMEVEFKKFGTDDREKSKAKKQYFVNSDGSKAGSTSKKEGSAAAKTTAKKEEKKEKPYPMNVEIKFAPKKFDAAGGEVEKVTKLAEYLDANPKVKVKILGHSDPSEESVPFIGKRRALNVHKELLSNGIDKGRIPYEAADESSRSDKAEENQKVTFEIM